MLAKVTGALEMAKAKTGINVLGIERVVVDVKLYGLPAPRTSRRRTSASSSIAHGDFNASALITFAKAESRAN